jgi:single-stranded DNA-binding protein
MNPISITVTGRLGDDPRTFTTRDGTEGVELRLALDIPARGSGEGVTRWIKVTAFGLLATRTGESVRKGAKLAAANGEPSDLPAGEQAELRVLRGVTTTS